MVNHQLIISIVTYESDIKQLAKAVDSIEGQCARYKIIITDNDSSTDYQQQLEQFADRATIINAPHNGGFGYGHNLALLEAEPSDYFLVLNPDVILHEGALQQLMAFLTNKPKAGLATPKVFYPDGSLQPLNKRIPNVLDLACRLLLPARLTNIPLIKNRLERYTMLDKGYDTAYQLPFASGCCMMFKRDILMRLGGFDEGFFLYFEDADITMRTNEIAESWFCPDATITHTWQRASRTSWTLLWVMMKSAARYFAKWGLKWW